MGCASENALKEALSKTIELESVDADVKFYRITDREAEELGLKGSPSVLINGKDIQPVNVQGFS